MNSLEAIHAWVRMLGGPLLRAFADYRGFALILRPLAPLGMVIVGNAISPSYDPLPR